jgi:hypothetical protein
MQKINCFNKISNDRSYCRRGIDNGYSLWNGCSTFEIKKSGSLAFNRPAFNYFLRVEL